MTTLAKDKQSKVEFDGVKVPASALVGELNQGWPAARKMLDQATALLCTQIVGAARKDVEMGIEYAKNRVAFGRPIGAFQSVQHMCADMTIWVDGAQMLTFEALWKMDEGLPARHRGFPGQGVLQRPLPGRRPFQARCLHGGHGLYDGVRPAPVVSPGLRLDHAVGNQL